MGKRAKHNPADVLEIRNFINNELVPPCGGQYFESPNPATGGVYAHVPDSSKTDVDTAVAAAKAAFPGWCARSSGVGLGTCLPAARGCRPVAGNTMYMSM
jgi:aldehyde dehydrogenase family protein